MMQNVISSHRTPSWSISPLSVIMGWHATSLQRRRLSGLDESALNDIGVTRAEALKEASRPFWM